jgi:hypothetical protein
MSNVNVFLITQPIVLFSVFFFFHSCSLFFCSVEGSHIDDINSRERERVRTIFVKKEETERKKQQLCH